MSYLVLARKYRPQVFDDVIGQAHVTLTLANAIVSQRVAHAMLFSGPRGTGKTTVARILAKAMNCEKGPTPVPCNRCRSCREITAGHSSDVFEIDGASNNSVDQIRELRDNVRYMPARSRHKIYIIDEVHMLSIAAFNALLKTLEEPPAHVLFMFATTEAHKIPVTILSRCQRHDFRRVALETIRDHLAKICDMEGFGYEPESLLTVAREAGGSVRDSLSLLDQVMSCSEKTIGHAQVLQVLGIIDRKTIFELADAVLRGDIAAGVKLLDDIYAGGHDLKKLYTELTIHVRNMLMIRKETDPGAIVDLPKHEVEAIQKQVSGVSELQLVQFFELLLREESTVRFSAHPKLAMEMLFFKLSQIRPTLPIDDLIEKIDRLRADLAAKVPGSSGQTPPRGEPAGGGRVEEPQVPPGRTSVAQGRPASAGAGIQGDDAVAVQAAAGAGRADAALDDAWEAVRETISENHPSLGAALARCRLERIGEDALELKIGGNGFSRKVIRRKKNTEIVERACSDYFGRHMSVKLTAEAGADQDRTRLLRKKEILTREALSHPLVAEAVTLFDGKVVDVRVAD